MIRAACLVVAERAAGTWRHGRPGRSGALAATRRALPGRHPLAVPAFGHGGERPRTGADIPSRRASIRATSQAAIMCGACAPGRPRQPGGRSRKRRAPARQPGGGSDRRMPRRLSRWRAQHDRELKCSGHACRRRSRRPVGASVVHADVEEQAGVERLPGRLGVDAEPLGRAVPRTAWSAGRARTAAPSRDRSPG